MVTCAGVQKCSQGPAPLLASCAVSHGAGKNWHKGQNCHACCTSPGATATTGKAQGWKLMTADGWDTRQ